MRELTTTSYAILGLLCLQPWTGYELAQQMKRGGRFTWPRARSGIYEEPKKLVEHGLATAQRASRGQRGQRTVYSVTPKGRKAMSAWLNQPSAEPRFESEALVRLVFADLGSKDELLATLAQLRDQAAGFRDEITAQAQGYLEGTSPFPSRLHLMVVVGRFIHEYVALLERWATWAAQEVTAWPDITDAAFVPDIPEKLEEILDVHTVKGS